MKPATVHAPAPGDGHPSPTAGHSKADLRAVNGPGGGPVGLQIVFSGSFSLRLAQTVAAGAWSAR